VGERECRYTACFLGRRIRRRGGKRVQVHGVLFRETDTEFAGLMNSVLRSEKGDGEPNTEAAGVGLMA
jgi:hypothetical protein